MNKLQNCRFRFCEMDCNLHMYSKADYLNVKTQMNAMSIPVKN